MNDDLYRQYVADLKLKGYQKRSIQSYVRAVRQLQNFTCKALEDVTEEDVREYWLYCKEELGWGSATLRISYSGLKLFFTHTWKRDGETLRSVKFERDQTLPLADSALELLRTCYKTHRNPTWVFPAMGKTGKGAPTADHPLSETTVHGALRRAVVKAGIRKPVRPHPKNPSPCFVRGATRSWNGSASCRHDAGRRPSCHRDWPLIRDHVRCKPTGVKTPPTRFPSIIGTRGGRSLSTCRKNTGFSSSIHTGGVPFAFLGPLHMPLKDCAQRQGMLRSQPSGQPFPFSRPGATRVIAAS